MRHAREKQAPMEIQTFCLIVHCELNTQSKDKSVMIEVKKTFWQMPNGLDAKVLCASTLTVRSQAQFDLTPTCVHEPCSGKHIHADMNNSVPVSALLFSRNSSLPQGSV